MNNSRKSKVESRKPLLSLSLLVGVLFSSCDPEAPWETENVKIEIEVQYVSSGFVECLFVPNKDAYYLIACEPVREDYNPMEHQKQFMMLAIDSANVEYLTWRNNLLKQGEFNIAPFSSHALQYGEVDHFFTGLTNNTDYWIYAFAVNPETLQPASKLYLQTIHTRTTSEIDIHFDYRVKDQWDYIYPIDSIGNVYGHFPYIATTCDSLEIPAEEFQFSPFNYFSNWASDRYMNPQQTTVYYGVQAVENDGKNGHALFQEGHIYYTAICGFDGNYQNLTIYKFRWAEDINLYFIDEDPENIAQSNEW